MADNKLITLEEAAERLEISPATFRQKLQTDPAFRVVSKIRDGSTFRFKPADIEELRRSLGFGSEEELQLVDPSSDEMTIPLEINLADDDGPKSKAPSSKKKIAPAKPPLDDDDAPLRLTEAELNLSDPDTFRLADDDGSVTRKSSSRMKPAATKPDSDLKLGQSGKIKRPIADDDMSDEVELDILPKAGSSTKLAGSSKGPPSSKKPPASKNVESSEFELNLDADSSDEFELSLANDSSDEISLGDMPPPSDGDSKAGLASGINLSRPKDAGLSLERGDGRSSRKLPAVKPDAISGKSSKKLPKVQPGESDDEIDFELSLDQPGASSKKLASGKNLGGSAKNLKPDDSSEFDLNLDDSGEIAAVEPDGDPVDLDVEDEKKNDIFETDFEIPALDDDSASEVVAIDEADTDLENSDFDLAIDETGDIEVDEESGSQVVMLDDEIEPAADEAPKSTKSKKKPKRKPVPDDEEENVSFDDMDIEDEQSASAALRGAHADVDDEGAERVVLVSSAPWGWVPAVALLPTVFVVFIAGLMAYEMMHSMWGYHQPTQPTSLVIDNVAEMFDLKSKEQ
jgi:hypothetical protein